jgi:hypothetical protein
MRFRWFTFKAFFFVLAQTTERFRRNRRIMIDERSVDSVRNSNLHALSAILAPLPCPGEDEGEGARIP